MAQGLRVTEKSGHAGEGEQTSEQTNVICDSEGRQVARHPGLTPALPPPPGPASLQLLGDELLVVEVAQPLLLHQGALSLQRVLVPPRRLRHAHAQLRLRALQQRAQRLEVLQLSRQMDRWTGVGGDGGAHQGKGREEAGRGRPQAGRAPQHVRLLGCGREQQRKAGMEGRGVGLRGGGGGAEAEG